MMKKILVTGGAGFIGSHTVVELQNAGYEPVIVDSLFNASADVIENIAKITGKKPAFEQIDCCDKEALADMFKKYGDVEAIIHFAAFKAVGESTEKPREYYRNNLVSLLNLLDLMPEYGVKGIVFSSSCTVYGQPRQVPVNEQSPILPANCPYGNTKQICEEIIRDTVAAGVPIKSILLRYFNPIGAHPTSLIGELPIGVPLNLVPYITQTAVGIRKELGIFGNDYDTPDGTGVRDYIHVCDLASGHVAALKAIQRKCGLGIYNLGTGHGYSVLDVVNAFMKVNDVNVPYVIKPRRPGDIATCYCNPAKAKAELGWEAQYGIEEMCRDSWNWQKKNPNGY